MALQTNPTVFSITALLADQVALVARHEGVSPGAASVLLRQLMELPQGRRRLLTMLKRELETEGNPDEAAKIAAVLRETTACADEASGIARPTATPERNAGSNLTRSALCSAPPQWHRPLPMRQ